MDTAFNFLRVFFGLFCWILVWCLAFWRGRWPERTAAAVTLALGVFSMLQRQSDLAGHFDWHAFITDSLLFLTFLVLAVRARRIWPIAAAGFQLVAVLTHFAVLVRNPGSSWAYASVSVLATWLVLIAFAVGLWENEVRRRFEQQTAIADTIG